jgi:hypothetical protein
MTQIIGFILGVVLLSFTAIWYIKHGDDDAL